MARTPVVMAYRLVPRWKAYQAVAHSSAKSRNLRKARSRGGHTWLSVRVGGETHRDVAVGHAGNLPGQVNFSVAGTGVAGARFRPGPNPSRHDRLLRLRGVARLAAHGPAAAGAGMFEARWQRPWGRSRAATANSLCSADRISVWRHPLNDKSIIIGAGFAGLAAGIHAQMNGYRTRIFEMHSLPGGLCTAWKRQAAPLTPASIGCWMSGATESSCWGGGGSDEHFSVLSRGQLRL